MALVVGLLAKRCVDGVTVRTVDVTFAVKGKVTPSSSVKAQISSACRALRPGVVAWEADDGEVIVFGVEALEIGILPGQAAGAGPLTTSRRPPSATSRSVVVEPSICRVGVRRSPMIVRNNRLISTTVLTARSLKWPLRVVGSCKSAWKPAPVTSS